MGPASAVDGRAGARRTAAAPGPRTLRTMCVGPTRNVRQARARCASTSHGVRQPAGCARARWGVREPGPGGVSRAAGVSIRCGSRRARLTGSSRRWRRAGPGRISRSPGPGRVPQRGQAPVASISVSQATWTNNRRRSPAEQCRLTPSHQGVNGRPQVLTRLRDAVFVPTRAVLVAFQQPGVDEIGEPRGEHGAGDVEVGEQVGEPADAEQAVAQHQQRPSLADDLQRPRERAVLPVVVGAQRHRSMLALRSVDRTGRHVVSSSDPKGGS